jgi:hypothetical protein
MCHAPASISPANWRNVPIQPTEGMLSYGMEVLSICKKRT